MEAPSWKHQLVLASYLAVLGGLVLRLLIPEYIEAPGLMPSTPFNLALIIVVALFFLPVLWWRTPVIRMGDGYSGVYVPGVIVGILAIVGEAVAIGAVVESAVESYIIIIPHFIFAVLLIVSSVLAWREG